MELVHCVPGPKNAADQAIDTIAMPLGLNSGRDDRGTTARTTERRLCTRYPIKLSARYESQGIRSSHTGEAIVTNLSIAGMCLLPDNELELGSRIRVSIQWPVAPGAKAPLELIGAGTVIRKDWSGVGIKLERKPIFQLRRGPSDADGGTVAPSGQQDQDEWSAGEAAGSDSRRQTAAPADRSPDSQRQGTLAIHDTADGLISTSVRKHRGRWVGHCWGGRHDYSCDGNDASEAQNGVDAFFHTMYPGHICSPRCYVAPMDDQPAPAGIRL